VRLFWPEFTCELGFPTRDDKVRESMEAIDVVKTSDFVPR
jgi:hypothetical protein